MLRIDRRSLLVTGTLGLGAWSIPGFAQTDNVATATGFTHSVASGEPASDSMLLWTRYVPTDGKPVHLTVELSEQADFAKIAGNGMLPAGGEGVVVPLALAFGGLIQLIAGLLEVRLANTFGMTAFLSYGAFWLWFGLLQIFAHTNMFHVM